MVKKGVILLSISYVLGVISQKLLEAYIKEHQIGYLIGVIAITLLFVGVIVFYWKKYRISFFYSRTFIATVLIYAAIAVGLGTLIIQDADIKTYYHTYGSIITKIILFLEFNDIFRSMWFIYLSAIVSFSLLSYGLRLKFNLRNSGVILAHIGMAIVLVGGFIGFIFGEKGFIEFHIGETKDSFYEYAKVGPTAYKKKLPFLVRVDNFRIERYPTKWGIVVYNPYKNVDKFFVLHKVGEVVKVNNLEIKLLKYIKNIKYDYIPDIANGGNKDRFCGLLEVYHKGNKILEKWLFNKPTFLSYIAIDMGTNLIFVESKGEVVSALSGGFGVIEYQGKHFPIEIGKTYKIDDKEFKILRVVRDFIYDIRTRQVIERSPFPVNPAVEVEIIDSKTGSKRREWVFSEKNPHIKSTSGLRLITKIELPFTTNNYFLTMDTGEIYMLKPDLTFEKVKDNTIKGFKFKLTKTNFSCIPKKKMIVLNDKKDSESPYFLLLVKQGDKEQKVELTLYSKSVLLDEGYNLSVAPKKEEPENYYSTISFIDPNSNAVKKTVTISVNDPYCYEGYCFYQSDYKEEDPSYTGILVVRDPGLFIVYIGFTLMGIGVAIALIYPYIKRKEG